MHLFEPFLGEKIENEGFEFEKFAGKRKDVWPSVEEAFETLRTRKAVRKWDERILKILIVSSLCCPHLHT